MFLRLLTLAAVAVATVTGTITNCDSNSVFKLSRMGLFPDPPVKGKAVDMIVEFENPGPEVVDGKVTTSLSLNYIPVPTSVNPLCEDTGCPIVSGFNNRSTSSMWPDSVGGKVNSKIVWTGEHGETLLCLQLSTTVAVDNSNALIEYQKPFWKYGNYSVKPKMHTHSQPVISTSSKTSCSPTHLRRNLRGY
jgi:hypothetical protein